MNIHQQPTSSAQGRVQDRFLFLPLLANQIPFEGMVAAFEDLARHYGESHRRYHALPHIEFGYGILDTFRHLARDPDALEVAWAYHDIICDIGVPLRQNEERSAAFIARLMRHWGFVDEDIGRVVEPVLATTHDHIPQSPDGRLMVDIDLAGLGQPWQVFLKNNRDVREEDPSLTGAQFREKNNKLLRRFLRTPVYYHPEIEARFGAQARGNLERWLSVP